MTNWIVLAVVASVAFTVGLFANPWRCGGISPRAPADGFKPSPSPSGVVGGSSRKGGINPQPSQIVDRPPDPGAMQSHRPESDAHFRERIAREIIKEHPISAHYGKDLDTFGRCYGLERLGGPR